MGVVAALTVEARTLGSGTRRADGLRELPDGTLVAISGMGRIAADVAARTLVDAGATALVSWGLAGGLDPSLTAGTICLPTVVISDDDALCPCDPHWREIVGAAIASRHRVVAGKLLTHRRTLDDVAAKAAAFRSTGAVAVDMESFGVAHLAAGLRLPFLAVRVIVDAAGDALPAAVLAASSSGQVRLSRLIQGLIRSPADLAPLLRLAQRYRAAMRSLRAVAGTGALASIVFAMPSKKRIA